MSSTSIDDRTTRARIRDAAIACYGRLGVHATTARKVAEAAGVSPGSVIHHFGSMDGLRTACDEHVASVIRQTKSQFINTGLGIDPVAASGAAAIGEVGAYLASVLHDDSPIVARLVDDLVDDAEEYIQAGVEAGTVRPTDDPRARAVLLTLWSLGSLVLHEHAERLLGVDLTDPDAEPEVMARYVAPILELFGGGLFNEAPPSPSPPRKEPV